MFHVSKWLLIYVLMLSSVCAYSQRRQIEQAQDQIKSGKNLDKAEAAMRKLLSDSTNRNNRRIWVTLIGTLTKQYELANEKLYLKQKYDTAQFFNLTKRLFDDIQTFDSIDALPDKKGRVSPRYRERHSEYLDRIRRNLFYGGVYHTRKGDFNKAILFLQKYIDCKDMPLFEDYDYAEKDSMMPTAAYWMMYCGNKMDRRDLVMDNEDMARRDTAHTDYVLNYLAEAYLAEKDTARYVRTLHEGMNHNVHYPYFFPRLVEYYNGKDSLDEAMKVVEQAMAKDSANVLFRTAKSTILLNQRRYDECIRIAEQLIAEDDSLAEPYYNVGLAYFDQAIELDKQRQKYKAKRRQMVQLYEKSRPYMEQYRQLAPSRADKWSLPLYMIYLNLNMGKEFDEIDKIRHEFRRKLP